MTNTTAAANAYNDSAGYDRRQPPPVNPVSSTPTYMLLTKHVRISYAEYRGKGQISAQQASLSEHCREQH